MIINLGLSVNPISWRGDAESGKWKVYQLYVGSYAIAMATDAVHGRGGRWLGE